MKRLLILAVSILISCRSSETTSAPTVTGQAGSMTRFALIDSSLIIVKPNQLQIWSVTDEDNPKLLNEVDAGNDVETIYAIDSNLFIGSETGLVVYTLETPWHPVFRSQFFHWRACDPVFVQDTIAFVTTRSGSRCRGGENKLFTINVTDLDSVYEIMAWNMANPHGLAVDDSLLFIADGHAGLKVFKVHSPLEIELLEVINTGSAYDVIANKGELVLIASDGLYQYNYDELPLKEISLFPIVEN